MPGPGQRRPHLAYVFERFPSFTQTFCVREVLELDHLHYGLWADEPLDLEGLKRAQERYAERLCDWVPEGVRTILDVGCGFGLRAGTSRSAVEEPPRRPPAPAGRPSRSSIASADPHASGSPRVVGVEDRAIAHR